MSTSQNGEERWRQLLKQSWPMIAIGGILIAVTLVGHALLPWDEKQAYRQSLESSCQECVVMHETGLYQYFFVIINHLMKLVDPQYEGYVFYPELP